MYPSSASSSSQGSMGTTTGGGLMRYGSAPSSVLSSAVDSVIGATRDFSAPDTQTRLGPARFFDSESAAMANHSSREDHKSKTNTTIGLQPAYGFAAAAGVGGSSSLLRHSSSPAGFLNQLAAAAGDANGFSISRGIGGYINSKGVGENNNGGNISRLNSQLSFTGKEALPRIYEEAEQDMASGGQKKSKHNSYAASTTTGGGGGAAAFGMGPWEHTPNSMMFSVAPPSRAKTSVVDSYDNIESQFQFSISQTAQDMASMEKLMNIPQDSVTCKIRAKRGCATHPRSIAERERRTRISGKLKKLQDLVPNMDKQTSYADMLDLAVQHIVCLQSQVQKLNKGLDSCTCDCKKAPDK